MIDFLLNKKKRILSHILFWIFVFALFAFLYGYRSGSYLQKLELQAKFAVFEIGFVYFTLYYLFPKFLMKRKIFLFSIFFIATLFVTLSLENIAMGAPKVFSYITFSFYFKSISTSSFFWLALENTFVLLLATAAKLLKIWYVNQKEKTELENRSLKSELELLKNQVNPHFLFNTLNNINTLVFIDQQKTYDSIIKLSELLRYMIYETRTEKVFLKEELNYIENYIELQRLRFVDKSFIDYKVKGESKSKMIAPMLFIPFIENAFKHGKKLNNTSPGISIRFNIADNQVELNIVNYTKAGSNEKSKDGGLGIENIKKRLELIYPEKHTLEISSDEKFSVLLRLQIK